MNVCCQTESIVLDQMLSGLPIWEQTYKSSDYENYNNSIYFLVDLCENMGCALANKYLFCNFWDSMIMNGSLFIASSYNVQYL